MSAEQVPLNRQTWLRFVQGIRNFVTSEVGLKAKLLFAGLVALLVAINGLNVVNSYVARDFITAIEQRSMSAFVWKAILYVGVFAGSTAAAVICRFTEERLGLLWRAWLTRRLISAYLEHPTYYRLNDHLIANGEIANPDQRIADDVRTFTATTLSFTLMFLNGSFTVLAFSGVMWSISPLLFVVGILYAAVGSSLTIVFGRPLVALNYAQLDKEAEFRSDLVYVRENAESLALSRQEERQRTRLLRRLDELIDNARRIVGVNRNLGFFTTGYNYMIQIIPALIVAPLFIRGTAEFGVITQSAMAFSQLLGAFSLIVTQFQSISSFTAVIARLSSLGQAIEQAQSVAVSAGEVCDHARRTPDCVICLTEMCPLPPTLAIKLDEEDGRLAYEGLTLHTPLGGRTLINELSVSVPPGMRVLIVGANESAPAALFRVTAGIWDVGEGRVSRPNARGIMFIPERPYLPRGTLRELLVRPGQEREVAEDQLLAALRPFQLEDLLARVGGFDVEQDWNCVLTLGEQQLIAFARLVLAAPGFAFLDRLGTTLPAERVDNALKALSERSITYLSIGENHSSLDQFDAVLHLAADGTWNWKPITLTIGTRDAGLGTRE